MFDATVEGGFRKYLAAIERYPVLDRQRELALARAFRDGDRTSGDLLVSCSLRYVVRIARRYRGYGFAPAELVAEGNVGLVQALRRFEPARGLRFMTYAAYWVRAPILRFILEHWSLVGVGTAPMQSKLFFRLQREKARILATIGDPEGVIPLVARRLECSEERVRKMEQRIEGRDVSLESKVRQDGPLTLADMLRTEDDGADTILVRHEVAELVRTRVTEALDRLDTRERMIVQRRILGGDDKETLAALGQEMGLSRERVRQLEQRVKSKLRRCLMDVAPPGASLAEAA